MYLSDRDLKFAVETRQLIVNPPPSEYDTTSVDLHLDTIQEAKIWDLELFKTRQAAAGNDPWLRIARYQFRAFSEEFCRSVPDGPAPNDWCIAILTKSSSDQEASFSGRPVKKSGLRRKIRVSSASSTERVHRHGQDSWST